MRYNLKFFYLIYELKSHISSRNAPDSRLLSASFPYRFRPGFASPDAHSSLTLASRNACSLPVRLLKFSISGFFCPDFLLTQAAGQLTWAEHSCRLNVPPEWEDVIRRLSGVRSPFSGGFRRCGKPFLLPLQDVPSPVLPVHVTQLPPCRFRS